MESLELAPTVSSEPLMSEAGEESENIGQGVTEPTPTIEQRRFSAPSMEWDATRLLGTLLTVTGTTNSC